MIERFKHLLRHLVEFNDSDLAELDRHAEAVSVEKGELLLRSGDICRYFYYVDQGCLRTFFLSRDGREKTRLVLHDCTIGTALQSFIRQQPSVELIEALEASTLLRFPHEKFYALVASSPRWQLFYTRILEMAYSFQTSKIESLVTLSAQQRYEKLLREQPALVQKLSNRALASYLDMREETLSRLKSGR